MYWTVTCLSHFLKIQLVAAYFELSMIKDVGEFLVAIAGILTNDELNFYLAFIIWFTRSFGLIGLLICLNEALFVRYLTKIIFKRIIIMNDALIGTWIKLSNIVVALILTVIQSQFSVGFQRNLEHFAKGPNPNNDNLSGSLNRVNMRIPFWLGISHLTLAIVVFLHVCIDKIKQRNTTPVIHINIPNPQALVNNLVAINNQAYNQDLIDFSSYLILFLANASVFLPLSLVVSLDLNSALAHYFQVSVSDFYTVFDLIRRLTHTLGIGFVSPLLLMLLSSELRPFLLNSLSCVFCVSTINPMHQVYE